jgi:hypothetical protein
MSNHILKIIMETSIIDSLRQLVKKKKYKAALDLSEKNQAFGELIGIMSDNNHYKTAIGFVQDKGLDIDSFPELSKRAMKKYVRYLISCSTDWEQTELQLLWSKKLLAFFAEDMFFKSTQKDPHLRSFKGIKKNKGKDSHTAKKEENLFEDDADVVEELKEEKSKSESGNPDFRDIARSLVERQGLSAFLEKVEIIADLQNPFNLIENPIILRDEFSLITSLFGDNEGSKG